MQEKFIDLSKKAERNYQKKQTQYNRIGNVKLLLFVLLALSLYYLYTQNFPTQFIFSSVGLVLLFIFLFFYQNRLKKELNYFQGILDLNQQYLARINGQWISFADTGEEFVDQEHPYTSDLDIVGEKSLFQLINLTHTWHGRQLFAQDLQSPNYEETEIIQRQKAIHELSLDVAFTNHLQYYLSKIGTSPTSLHLLQELSDSQGFLRSSAIQRLIKYGPWFTLAGLAAIFFLKLHSFYLLGIILILIQTTIWLLGWQKTRNYLGSVGNSRYILQPYQEVMVQLAQREFKAHKLQDLQAQLSTGHESAFLAIKKLSQIAHRINTRSNGLMAFLLNIFLLWDYQCALQLAAWKGQYGHAVESWFQAIGEFECLLSFSCLPNICNHTCYPQMQPEEPGMRAQALGHPLLPNAVRVNNDLNFHREIFIISGSNMSGKTTFLRTVGINLVLAQAGSSVCAKQMVFSPLKIMTSLRVVDDLHAGLSTFYAELSRIKGIIQLAQTEPQLLFLIDEIFNGTNSVDRMEGAKTVISKLSNLKVLGIITTHDLELCALADQNPGIKNYSFSEYYTDNRLHFDYKMKPGKSTTTNARYLMEMVGILD